MSPLQPASSTVTPPLHTVSTHSARDYGERTAEAVPVNAKCIELRQARTLHKCGVPALRIDLQISNSHHVYSIGVYSGFVGGGKGEDQALLPRIRVNECIPKYVNAAGNLSEIWPPYPALARKVDGKPWDDTSLPQGNVPERLEKAMAAVEPLLRQLVNQRQQHMDEGQIGRVSDFPLINRIKHILENY